MKKLLLTLIFVSISNLSYAGSCPMLWAEVDGKLAEIQKLRDDGKKLMTTVIILNLKSF